MGVKQFWSGAGLPTTLHTAPSLVLKVQYPETNSAEKVIGYATNLSYSVTQGQKEIMVVDSPFPAEVAQSAGPSMVRGSLVLYLPKDSSPEKAGLIPYRTTDSGENNLAQTRYLNIRIYDRSSGSRVFALDFCKFGSYSVSIAARQIVRVEMQFSGMFCTPG